MTKKEAGVRRWLCQIYNLRGRLTDRQWTKFAEFCENNDFMDTPPPGVRADGQDAWDVFEEQQ